jgi:hypothetical protein
LEQLAKEKILAKNLPVTLVNEYGTSLAAKVEIAGLVQQTVR